MLTRCGVESGYAGRVDFHEPAAPMSNTSPSCPPIGRRLSASVPAWLALALWLSACGGGGGDAGVAPAAQPAQPAASAAQAVVAATEPAAAASATAPATCGLPDFAAAALQRINDLRAAGATCGSHGAFAPAAALAWNAQLNQAASAHSQDMATQNYFSHTSADGRSMSDRINATGYSWSALGENIAAGYLSVNAVLDGWMSSDGHCANLMSPGFSEVGLACVPGTAASSYNTYWTMDLAKAH
jgi:uncharacterized protein YkwD